jgi:hypothetical protein
MTNEATASDHIKQVIESGTPYQRLILLATSVAHWAYTDAAIEPPLTPQEHAQLQASFRTPAEKRLLQKYKKVDDSIRLFILQLSQHLVEHDLVLAHINRLNEERIMLSVTIPEFCDVIGSAIAKRFGWKQQVEIFREAAKHKLSRIFGSKTKLLTVTMPDTGEPRALFTFPDFALPNSADEIENLAGDEYFVASLVAWGKRLTKTRRIAKANLKVLQEVMKAERFNLKPYKHFLKQAEKRLRTEPPLTVLQTYRRIYAATAKISLTLSDVSDDQLWDAACKEIETYRRSACSEREKKRVLILADLRRGRGNGRRLRAVPERISTERSILWQKLRPSIRKPPAAAASAYGIHSQRAIKRRFFERTREPSNERRR